MRRRKFIKLIGSAAAAYPLAAWAQQASRFYRLGVLTPVPRDAPTMVAFFDELRVNDFIEGQNLTVVPGGFGVADAQINEVAAAIVKAAPDVITAGPDPQLRALQVLTRTIPIVGMTEDMVGSGFVASLVRPGGNITGISLLSPELDGKRMEILLEAVPGVRHMAAIAEASDTSAQHLATLRNAASARGVELAIFSVNKPEEIPMIINEAKAAGAEALNFLAGPIFLANRRIIFEQVAAGGLPAIYQWPEMAEDGGFMAYGSRFGEMFRQRARMVVKVLHGAKPADMPVEQPTRFELVVNLKTAKALGLTIPEAFLVRADKVVE
jgi:putative tryptophan/tyrosine transport system substrate-binding protein